MPRRFDKRGWNRQFKWQPVRRDRWDPFPKDHLPFVDDYSAGMYIHKSIKDNRGPAREKLPLDTHRTPSGKRKRGNELFTPKKVAKAGIMGAAGRQLYKSKTLQRALRHDAERAWDWIESRVGGLARAAGEGIVEAEDAMGLEAGSMFSWIGREAAALEEPLLAAGTELAEFAILL